jgi:hypothetical protein
MERVNHQQDFEKTYIMVSPRERKEIIQKIKNEELVPSGPGPKTWNAKHHPNNVIPRDIYLLGDGTIQELFDQYNQINIAEPIEWGNFIGYTRELIKQGIMI